MDENIENRVLASKITESIAMDKMMFGDKPSEGLSKKIHEQSNLYMKAFGLGAAEEPVSSGENIFEAMAIHNELESILASSSLSDAEFALAVDAARRNSLIMEGPGSHLDMGITHEEDTPETSEND